MNVNLTPTLDEYVLSKVRSGRYNNASEVIREALRYMQERDAAHTEANLKPARRDTNVPDKAKLE